MRLLKPPYRPPECAMGDTLYCAYHDDDVEVIGFSSSKTRWPMCRVPAFSRHPLPIVCGDLIKAITLESASVVAAWWGVSRYTVTRWRRKFGVARMNEGTRKLWAELASKRLTKESRKKGGRHAKRGSEHGRTDSED